MNKASITPKTEAPIPVSENKGFTLEELTAYAHSKGLTGRDVKGELYDYCVKNGLSTKSLQIN